MAFVIDFSKAVNPEKNTEIASLLKNDAQFEWKRGETVAFILKKLIRIWKQCLATIHTKSEIPTGEVEVTVVDLLEKEETQLKMNYVTAEQCVKNVTEIMQAIIADVDLARWMANAARHHHNKDANDRRVLTFMKNYIDFKTAAR